MSHAREERLSCLEWSKKEAHATDLQALDRFIANRFDHECGSGVDISRLNDFLIRISDFFSALELVSARSLHFEKYAAKKKIFTMAIEKTKGRSLDVVGPYREMRFFRDQNRLLIDLARDRMLNSIKRHFDLPENAVGEIVKRITRKDLAAVSQAEYVIHVTHLFNLESRITEADFDNFLKKLSPYERMHVLALSGSEKIVGRRFKDVIPFLLNCFPVEKNARDFTTRNSHPAPLLLQQCCGMIFHPGHQNTALTDTKSPYAFENIGKTFAYKFFEAEHHGRLSAFFEEAFVVQHPCFEAVAENLMNFDAVSQPRDTVFHSAPIWDTKLTPADNIGGILAWVEREMLDDYGRHNAIDVGQLSLKEVNQLESSRGFAEYLMHNESALNARVKAKAGNRISDDDLHRLVREDLLMGLSLV